MPWSQSRFEIDGLGTFDGYGDGETWNGWACPVFPLAEADRIAEVFRAQSDAFEARYDPDTDEYVFRDPEDDPDEAPLAFGSGTIDVGGELVTVWFIGTRYWTWEEVPT